MSGEYVELLKHRSEIFKREALRLLDEGEYDLSLFFIEQSVQLAIKATIYKLFGIKPRVHSIRQLLGILAESLREAGELQLADEIRAFIASNRDTLVLLEDSYTAARYGYIGSTREDVDEALRVLDKLYELLEKIERGEEK